MYQGTYTCTKMVPYGTTRYTIRMPYHNALDHRRSADGVRAAKPQYYHYGMAIVPRTYTCTISSTYKCTYHTMVHVYSVPWYHGTRVPWYVHVWPYTHLYHFGTRSYVPWYHFGTRKSTPYQLPLVPWYQMALEYLRTWYLASWQAVRPQACTGTSTCTGSSIVVSYFPPVR
jgi:hypothetical protein